MHGVTDRADISHETHWSSDRLMPLVYDELRRLAASRMRKEAEGHTLQATALVHEAWIRLAGSGEQRWESRAHFFGAASHAMRHILVHHARRKSALKRQAESFQDSEERKPEDYLLMVHESLDRLEKSDPDAAKIVLLKFFSGLGSKEIAEMTGSSVRSVERRWALAKAKLYQMMQHEDDEA
ncbi:sigma-70 family RNA polymerase sigma factor [Luteolibacter pohnpeiensis]|uniref:Sigma-70 family RNA polymerase sigma factor n=1 Tax=Luteolibacter pohnpeiensis TaxID=454153 RepID=A0A934S902_9BACT|nr:ECF-type sigma factor [Luteolibacter pohnpeiensis]MBK1883560.1 sigma-70 family RNA polymerase sigma factor [Luteolibacter pohnpeiensis]